MTDQEERKIPMILSNALQVALEGKDGARLGLLGAIVDALRWEHGLNYVEVFEEAQAVSPELTRAEWDALMDQAGIERPPN